MAKTLRVRCNPHHVLDADGRGISATPFEGMDGRVYVGADIDHEASKAENRVVFRFDEERVVEVPCTAYYLRKVLDEELLPADLDTEDFIFPDRKEARRREALAIEEGIAKAQEAEAAAKLAGSEPVEASAPTSAEEHTEAEAHEPSPAT